MTTEQDEARNAIFTLTQEFAPSVQAQDADRLVQRVYAEEARLLPPNQFTVQGHSNIRDFWRGRMEAGLRQLEVSLTEIHVAGHLAYGIGEYWLHRDPPGGDAGKHLAVYGRQSDGSWKVVAHMFSTNLPVEMTP